MKRRHAKSALYHSVRSIPHKKIITEEDVCRFFGVPPRLVANLGRRPTIAPAPLDTLSNK